MILSKDDPRKILYRSDEPVLKPELEAEKAGTVAEVVFPTGVDQRNDPGQPDRSTFTMVWQMIRSALHHSHCLTTFLIMLRIWQNEQRMTRPQAGSSFVADKETKF